MVRKIILMGVSLVLASGVLMISVYRTSAQGVMESIEAESVEVGETGNQLPEIKKEIDYALAWPGILPDHFLYPVKMVRDRIWLFLTSDALKKAELLLKFADKRVLAASILIDKDEPDLALSTADKAEKYLEQSMAQLKIAEAEGQDVSVFKEKLKNAILKHQEKLLEIEPKIAEESKLKIETLILTTAAWYQEVD